MIKFKVCCKHASRRFILSRFIGWFGFESQLRNLFSIPCTSKFIVSYIDEDGDEITISSDIELDEVIAQASMGIPIRLFLTILPSDVEETVVEMEQLKIKDVDHDATGSYFAQPEITEIEIEPEQNVRDYEEKCKDFSSFAEEEVDHSNSDSEIYFIITNSRDSRREPKFGHARLDSSECFNNCHFLRDDLHSHHRNPFYSGREVHGKSYLTPEKILHVAESDHREDAKESYARHHHHGPLTPEELDEKIRLLNSMGFSPEYNAHYEELLKKSGGRIGYVVETLLCERKHEDEGKDKESQEDSEIHEVKALGIF
ncbi:1387_t:CDS:2 [Acaulospora morrowiae]|uniref:1387_t:CDS:1 n=1 Tax=Acaulospora morrowiae TaxID=94023 RepID=A0A9N9FMT0_9GLOM|nr:1387_t:CDS:2 [Acaulospora morrowiae]